MGRNGLLGCCFSSGHASSSAGQGFAKDDDSPSDTEDHPKVSHPTPVPPPPPAAGTVSSPVHSARIPYCKLAPLPPDPAFPHHAVGIDDEVKSVIRLLEWEEESDVAVAVVLHGFGGTGKTTLADAVVATLDMQGWECFTVVPNSQSTDGSAGDGSHEAERAFIYMDMDSDSALPRKEDVEKLLPKSCKRLRILLTARDEMAADVISGCERGIRTKVYPVRPLHSRDAMKLLSNKLGVKAEIPQHQMNEIVEVCDGVPVVVERVGAYICQSPDKDEAFRRVIEWSKGGKAFGSAEDQYSIEKKGLLFDLENLPPSARESFLDICSFFNGWGWEKLSCIMGEDELNILRSRALLYLKKESSDGNKVMLRPIVSRIGRNLTKGKRFTTAPELSEVLEANDRDHIGGIKGIWLQDNISEPFLISAETLDLMHNSLRVLALGDMTIILHPQSCTRQFKQLIYFQAGRIPGIPFQLTALQELRFLDCRLDHNENDFRPKEMSSKLKVLNLNGGRYAGHFDSGSVFSGLRTLKLAEFKTLRTIPGELLSLAQLDLSGCRKLHQLPNELGNLKRLTKLILRSCGSLRKLPDSFGELRALKYLDLHSCVSLEKLPEDFGSLSSLEELDLGTGYLKELPSTFEQLSSLKVLSLMHCGILEYLPDNIGNLSALVKLEFEGSGLRSIPPSIERLNSNPVSVSIAHCSSLKDLPEEFCSYLKSVKDLSFGRCQSLTNLPKRLVELGSLTRLDLYYCTNLERLPENFGQLKSLAMLNLKECHSLQELPADFHCLPSLQSLNMQWCMKLGGKWMDTVGKIKSLEFVDIVGSIMLLGRWTEMEIEKENEGESWQFVVRTNRKKCKNILNKAASKLLTGKCLLSDSHEKPFSLSTVVPNTLLLVMYEHEEDSWTGPWRLLEEIVVRHDRLLMPFQMIYVGKHFGALSKEFAGRILAYAPEKSDAFSLFYSLLEIYGDYPSHFLSNFVLTDVVTDEKGCNHFSRWEDITHSCVEFFASMSSFYSDLRNLTVTPQKSNEKLLRTLINSTDPRTSAPFLRNYTEKMGIDQLRGKTVLLLISLIDEQPFQSLKEIYPKLKASDNLELLSIPIPVEVRGRQQQRLQHQVDLLPYSALAGLESILRTVPWPVLGNPWSLRTEVCYFIEREWGELNPAILVVVDPSGRICSHNALPLIEAWGAEVCPFTQEKMKQLEEVPPEEHLSEYILNGLLKK